MNDTQALATLYINIYHQKMSNSSEPPPKPNCFPSIEVCLSHLPKSKHCMPAIVMHVFVWC